MRTQINSPAFSRALVLLFVILAFTSVTRSSAGAQKLPSRDGADAPPQPRSGILVVDIEKKGKANRGPLGIRKAFIAAGAARVSVIHYSQLTPLFLKKHRPQAVVLSGQGTPWWEYDAADVARISKVLREIRIPVLGICGGHQLLGIAYGGKVAPIRRLRPGTGYDGCVRERGWLPVRFERQDALFRNVPAKPQFWFNHCEEMKVVPKGFVRIATDARNAPQAIRHRSKPVYGVQFHPEVAGADGFGKKLIVNFITLAGTGNGKTANATKPK